MKTESVTIYSEKYENLVLWVGELSRGKTLNVERTDREFTRALGHYDWETVMRDFAHNESSFLCWDNINND